MQNVPCRRLGMRQTSGRARGDVGSQNNLKIEGSGNTECAPLKTGATAWDCGLRNG